MQSFATPARAGIVHRDPGRCLRSGARNVTGFRQEVVLLEANDEWQLQNRYMQTEPMTELMTPAIDAVPTQIATMAA